MARNLLIALLLLPTIAACKTKEERLIPPPIVATPLELDPTEKYELSAWWSNGREMLHLNDSQAYALYGSMNRYSKPIERGRWDKQSYAVLKLEPYGTRRPEPRRVSITKIDGKLALLPPERTAMFSLNQPPKVNEDKLIGDWTGPLGSLSLDGKLRYIFSPVIAEDSAVVKIAGHQGKWMLAQDVLTLYPDTPGMPPIQMKMKTEGETTTLTSAEGEFQPAGL